MGRDLLVGVGRLSSIGIGIASLLLLQVDSLEDEGIQCIEDGGLKSCSAAVIGKETHWVAPELLLDQVVDNVVHQGGVSRRVASHLLVELLVVSLQIPQIDVHGDLDSVSELTNLLGIHESLFAVLIRDTKCLEKVSESVATAFVAQSGNHPEELLLKVMMGEIGNLGNERG